MTKSTSDRISIPITKIELAKMKVKAIRRGFWFKVLSRTERATIDLTIRVVERVRSILLAKLLGTIISKLLDAMKSKVARLMREVGRSLAKKLSRIAQSWGNKSAVNWETDPSYVRHLTITYMNTPPMFKA